MTRWKLLAAGAFAGLLLSIMPACALESDAPADDDDPHVSEAQSALTNPLNCPVSGWNFVPYHLSSRRFPYAARSAASDIRYANNLDYRWQMWFNQNVTSVQFVFEKGAPQNVSTGTPPSPGFELEANFDFLVISGQNTVSLTGNLDQNNTVEFTTTPINPSFAQGANDNYVNLEFKSDGSVTFPGWTMKGVWVFCGRANTAAGAASNVSRLHANGEREGVLLGTGDVRYFSTVQAANQELILHLRPDTPAPNHADFDLYADVSPNTTPGPGSAAYSSARGRSSNGVMLDDTIRIPPSGTARYVWFSVYAFSGSGGYRVYDNSIGQTFAFRVGTEFNYRSYDKAAFFGQNFTSLIRNDLYQTAGGLYQAVDGTARITQFDLYNNDTTCGGLGCQFVLWSKETCDSWGFWGGDVCVGSGACNFGNTGEKVNVCGWAPSSAAAPVGVALAHELGHCMYTFWDEYNTSPGAPGGHHDGHTIMNGPIWDNNNDYCTDSNHLRDPLNPDSSATKSTSNWADMKRCFPAQFTSYYVTGTPDPETWYDSDIWSTAPGMTTIFEH